MKNTLEGINSRLGDIEESISDLKDRLIQITQPCSKKKNKLKNKNCLRDLWKNIKHTNICIIGVPEG